MSSSGGGGGTTTSRRTTTSSATSRQQHHHHSDDNSNHYHYEDEPDTAALKGGSGGGGGGYYDDDSPPFLPLEEQPPASAAVTHRHQNRSRKSNKDEDAASRRMDSNVVGDGGDVADSDDDHDDDDYDNYANSSSENNDDDGDASSSSGPPRNDNHLLPGSSVTKQQRRKRKKKKRGGAAGGGARRRGGVGEENAGGNVLLTKAKEMMTIAIRYWKQYASLKTFISFLMFFLISVVFFDTIFHDPEDRYIQPAESSMQLLQWVQLHPLQGLIAILFVIAFCVVVMVPLGTPLTLGCGYIYKGAYGWKIGIFIATVISMAGSALGAVICFLLGRYLMRDVVRKWIKKYPLFDAIDIASAEHGLRIMAMLYLTPILPLGPVSYMCGTTSMKLSSFVLAKVAATPLMMLYVFIGASTGSLIASPSSSNKSDGTGSASDAAAKQIQEIEENEYLIISGIVLSFVMIACITSNVRKELNKILERQQKLKPGEKDEQKLLTGEAAATEEAAIEMGITRRRVA